MVILYTAEEKIIKATPAILQSQLALSIVSVSGFMIKFICFVGCSYETVEVFLKNRRFDFCA